MPVCICLCKWGPRAELLIKSGMGLDSYKWSTCVVTRMESRLPEEIGRGPQPSRKDLQSYLFNILGLRAKTPDLYKSFELSTWSSWACCQVPLKFLSFQKDQLPKIKPKAWIPGLFAVTVKFTRLYFQFWTTTKKSQNVLNSLVKSISLWAQLVCSLHGCIGSNQIMFSLSG